jgi:hypothetical protein
MSGRRALHERLAGVPIAGEAAARERTALGLAAAFDARTQRRAIRTRRRRLTPVAGTAIALTITAAALAASGQGGAVTRWIADLVDPPPAARRLDRLPAPGRLLTVGAAGARVIDADGTVHELGRYGDASWSPHAMFVVAVDGARLAALEPDDGDVRWTLTATAPVADARWGPDGYRIAYRSGRDLRVVAGDGSGDHLVAERVAPVAPAWQAGTAHVLAYVTAAGSIRVSRVDVPAGRTVARVHGAGWIAWAGRRTLLAATARRLVVAGTPRRWTAPAGTAIVAQALAPDGRHVALLLRRRGLSRILLLRTSTLRPERAPITLAHRLRGLTWSPDGRWLATARPGAAQWLLVPAAAGGRPRALRGATQPRDWCCSG